MNPIKKGGFIIFQQKNLLKMYRIKAVSKYRDNGLFQEYSWLKGQQKPDVNRFEEFQHRQIEEFTADGEELLEIMAVIRNMPTSAGKYQQIWKAPFAQFIFDNL